MAKEKRQYFVFEVCYRHQCERKHGHAVEKNGHGLKWNTSAKLYADCEHAARRGLIYSMLNAGYWVIRIDNAEQGVV